MREFLFRGKEVDANRWIEGCLSLYSEPGAVEITYPIKFEDPEFNIYDSFDFAEVSTDTVSQFIGITDKNGKKIFEGDIVEFHGGYAEGNWIGEVKYDERNAMFVLVGFMPCRYDSRHPNGFEVQISSRDKATFEVIGNRWDNPEYLGEDVYERLLVQR